MTRISKRTFRAMVPISVPQEDGTYVDYNAGDDVSDIPSEDATWLIDQGCISPLKEDGTVKEPEVDAVVATHAMISGEYQVETDDETGETVILQGDTMVNTAPSAEEQGHTDQVMGDKGEAGAEQVETMGQVDS